MIRPFWRYYGGKWRAAPLYPPPQHDTIIEPFAGAAGYSLRYPHKRILLVEKYAVIAEMWRWLIGATEAEVRTLPIVRSVDDLPQSTPAGARALIGFCFAYAAHHPQRQITKGCMRKIESGARGCVTWNEAQRERVASQVSRIRHWRVLEGEYTLAPDIRATYFVDPPYNNNAGKRYVWNSTHLDYPALARWCRSRRGQVIVCEQAGASWLPFDDFALFREGPRGTRSREVIWTNDPRAQQMALELG